MDSDERITLAYVNINLFSSLDAGQKMRHSVCINTAMLRHTDTHSDTVALKVYIQMFS